MGGSGRCLCVYCLCSALLCLPLLIHPPTPPASDSLDNSAPQSYTHLPTHPPTHHTQSHSLDGSSASDSLDNSAPQSYTWRNIRCSYESKPSRGSKLVEVEVLHGVDGHLEHGQVGWVGGWVDVVFMCSMRSYD